MVFQDALEYEDPRYTCIGSKCIKVLLVLHLPNEEPEPWNAVDQYFNWQLSAAFNQSSMTASMYPFPPHVVLVFLLTFHEIIVAA